MPGELRIGISGWIYRPWRGVFYPPGLVQKRELAYASRELNSIEINGTFYSLQRPASFQQWRRETPDGFVFSVKGGRFLTHMLKLTRIETPLANFFAQGVLALEEKLGPILWQFPEGFAFNEDRFARFFEALPRDTAAAAALAERHDARLNGRSWTTVEEPRPLRYTVEVRHRSFLDDRFVALCRAHRIAITFADTAGRWPYMEDVTADFVYARLHGAEELYVSGYSDGQLAWWADRLRAWAAGKQPGDAETVGAKKPLRRRRDAYIYFDNDAKVKAPFDAMRLAAMLGVAAWPGVEAEAEGLLQRGGVVSTEPMPAGARSSRGGR